MQDPTIIRRLNVEGADPLALAGVNDANLAELAKGTGVRVGLRGDVLSLTGPSEQVDRAAEVAQRMVDAARQGAPLDADDVLRLVMRPGGSLPSVADQPADISNTDRKSVV